MGSEELHPIKEIPFFQCGTCRYIWWERDLFLSDPQVLIAGYQVNFFDLDMGLLLFNHTCGTTFSLHAGDFKDLYKGPLFSQRLTGSRDCLGFCKQRNELQMCSAACECAYVRRIIQVIRTWPKGKVTD